MKVTVVIAVWPDTAGLAECLTALEPQADAETEMLAVSTLPAPEVAARLAWLRWVRDPAATLIPHLWARGIAEASGEIVAVTTAHFAPASDWLERMRAAHRRHDAVGIGGGFDPPRGGGSADWATYFLRYGKYRCLTTAGPVPDIAADNASYKRGWLDGKDAMMQNGFWEADFHRLVPGEGGSLIFDPTIRVTQRASFGVWRFCRQRLHHGRRFGATRMTGRSRVVRWAAACALPLIPLILLAKVTRWAWRSRRDLAPFLLCLPVLALFVVSWAVGESWGYLGAAPASTEHD